MPKGPKNAFTAQSRVPHKKTKGNKKFSSNASNAKILEAVENLHKMMLNFGEEMKQNTLSIAIITKAVEFNTAEVQECKGRNSKIFMVPIQQQIKNWSLAYWIIDQWNQLWYFCCTFDWP